MATIVAKPCPYVISLSFFFLIHQSTNRQKEKVETVSRQQQKIDQTKSMQEPDGGHFS